jgi:hypothetical protein
VVWPQTHSDGFLSLGLKTGSSGLVIWASKLPRRFLSLGLKTKQASVCQLHHKIDGGRSAQNTSGDLVACFMWKQGVFQSGLKTDRCAMTGGLRGTIMEVALRTS